MSKIATLREREFADILQYASDDELLRQAQLLKSEINQKYHNTRSPVADLLRSRLSQLQTTIGLSTVQAA